jgi:hypothetical protein
MATVTTDTQDSRPYPLGYTETEFARLERQAGFFGDLTEVVLRRAGVAPSMHVSDFVASRGADHRK